jgi:photosystem II stability/assembly factor-like uncharacterized protein
LSRSTDGGQTWEDATQIKYPEGARYLSPPPPTEEDPEGSGPTVIKNAVLLKLWMIAFGPGGRIYVGTIPGGLFVSEDGGDSFELNRPLWNHDSRGGDLFAGEGTGKTHWFGTPASEGEFAPGIHSIVVDPQDSEHLFVAISTAGVLESTDGGKSWRGCNQGMSNDYLPDPNAEWGHDPHFVTLCPGAPQHLWQQNHCGVFYSADGARTWKRVSQKEQGLTPPRSTETKANESPVTQNPCSIRHRLVTTIATGASSRRWNLIRPRASKAPLPNGCWRCAK